MAHLLGVDHAGHTFDIDHPEMDRKMREIDSLLKEIHRAMDDNTTLVILGDHGMIDDGNHGGELYEEKSTLLFMNHKNHNLRLRPENSSQPLKRVQ